MTDQPLQNSFKDPDVEAVKIIAQQMLVIVQALSEQNKQIPLDALVRMICHFYENKEQLKNEAATVKPVVIAEEKSVEPTT